MANLKDLPEQLKPYYKDLQRAKSKTEILYALSKLLQEQEKLPADEKSKLEKIMLNTPMGRHKKCNTYNF